MRWDLLSGMLLAAALGGGCAGPRYYADLRAAPDPRSVGAAGAREALLADLPQVIAESGVKRVDVVTAAGVHRVLAGRGQAPDLAAVSTPSLAALKAALQEDARGAELDLLLPNEEGQRVAVSAQHEPGGAVVVTQGPVFRATAATPPTAIEVRARHGISPSDLGEVRWTPPYLQALDVALSLLDAQERAFVSRILIVREHRSRDVEAGRGSPLAMYVRGVGAARIELYDALLDSDRYLFVGNPVDPHPSSVRAILHQFAHALADASNTLAQRDLVGAVADYHSDEKKLAQWIETREGEAPTEGDVSRFEDKIQRVEVTAHRLQRLGPEGPVIRAYGKARGVTHGPTRLGDSDLEESFAEAFSLFRADPDALRRIDPAAFAWFEGLGHIQALAH